MKITGLEANFLLYLLDEYCLVDDEGNLTCLPNIGVDWRGYNLKDLQNLRDRLFAAHEHPEESLTKRVEALEEEISRLKADPPIAKPTPWMSCVRCGGVARDYSNYCQSCWDLIGGSSMSRRKPIY